MNDAPIRTDGPAGEADNPQGTGAGGSLRQAREARHLTTADVAAQLHLEERIIVALEKNDLSQLPAPIYVRGYVRAYAKILDLDEDSLLTRYQPADTVPLQTVGFPESDGSELRRSAFPWSGIALLLLVAMVVAVGVFIVPDLYDRLRGAPEEGTDGGGSGLLPGAPRSAPSMPAVPENRSLLPPAPVTREAPEPAAPAADTPADTPVEPAPATAPVPVAPTLPAAEEEATPQAAADRVGEAPSGEAGPPGPVQPLERAQAPQPQAEDTTAPSPPAAPGTRRLTLEVTTESWVSIKDASGRSLLVGLYEAGEDQQVEGTPPLEVVLGNAAGVQLRVDGRRYPLSQYDPGSVARFTIE